LGFGISDVRKREMDIHCAKLIFLGFELIVRFRLLKLLRSFWGEHGLVACLPCTIKLKIVADTSKELCNIPIHRDCPAILFTA
jgi:hypothetical protein